MVFLTPNGSVKIGKEELTKSQKERKFINKVRMESATIQEVNMNEVYLEDVEMGTRRDIATHSILQNNNNT